MISPELLRQYPYFSGVEDAYLRKLAMLSQERSFSPGETLFEEGAEAKNLYIVIQGEVDVQVATGAVEGQTVDTLVGGDIMVWSALVPPHRTRFSGVARGPVRAVVMEAAGVRALCEENPRLGYALMREVALVISRRLEGARVQIATQ